MSKKLRPYQLEAVEDIYKAWETHNIVFYCLPTGGGKSVIFTQIIKDQILNQLRTMLIAHRKELITQAHEHLYNAKIYSGIIMRGYETRYDLKSQVCSIQTIVRKPYLPLTHVVIIDEGHHVTDSNSYNSVLLKVREQYPDAKILLVSATPYRLSGEGFTDIIKGEKTKLILGKSIVELIEEGWLVPFKYYVASTIDTTDISKIKGDYKEDDVYKKVISAPIVESYIKYVPNKQGIVYATNVKHSKDLTKAFKAAGINAAHLDADTPKEEREQILADYVKGIIKVVVNVGILTEGTDFPNCDFVLWACLTLSLSKYLQGCGRAARPLRGLVDQYQLASDRCDAIAASEKPYAIIVDCTGMVKEHLFADTYRDWHYYFKGTKGEKREQTNADDEITIYVFEDEKGVIRRSPNFEEVEGMELIEVTREIRQKIVNVKSVREFDTLFAKFKNLKHSKAPAYLALGAYMKFCEQNNFLIVPEIWDYIKRVLVDNVDARIDRLAKEYQDFPDRFPEDTYYKTLSNIKRERYSSTRLIDVRANYETRNKSQLDNYRAMKNKLQK